MKLVTLLTTFIITLASSNVFSQTFVCENWIKETEGEIQESMFVGEKVGDNFIIKNYTKRKKTLTFIGEDGLYTYYISKIGKSHSYMHY